MPGFELGDAHPIYLANEINEAAWPSVASWLRSGNVSHYV